ncbi:ras GEF [Peniophora sp. CONT]|nr:ras GEF [Peniophora sp. CONT]
MSVDELLPLSTVRGYDSSVSLVYSIYSYLDSLKVHQAQCRDLGRRCGQLLLSLAEYTRDMSSEERAVVTDEVEHVISRVHNRIHAWSGYSRTRAFIRQTEIRQGVQDAYDELSECSAKFSMSLSTQQSNTDGRAALETEDGALIRGVMADVLQDIGELKLLLSTYPPEETEAVMQAIQEELHTTGHNAPDIDTLHNGMWELHQLSDRLPPLSDLTGQVTKSSQSCALAGGSNDIYRGHWLGRQEVSLWFPRNQTPVAQMLFQEQVARWRTLDHDNILRLYGTATVDGAVCSVSPWFESVMAQTYVQERTASDRIRILADIASGMAYLHANDVAHGDLRGANIMISSTGEVRISSYGLSEFFEESSPSLVRWQAPEVINPATTVPAMPPADVWSFAMLCLELLSGKPPYSEYPKDTSVAVIVVNGTLPKRPSLRTTPTLTDALWALFERCWARDPAARPPMSDVEALLRQLVPSSEHPAPRRRATETPLTASSSSGSYASGTPSTIATSISGSDASSLRRFPSVLSQFSARRSSSFSSPGKTPSSTNSSDVPAPPSRAPTRQSTAPPLPTEHSTRSRSNKSNANGKGLFRIASLSRLRAKNRSNGSVDEAVPPLPVPSTVPDHGQSGRGADNVAGPSNPRPGSSSGIYAHRPGASLTSLASIDDKVPRPSTSTALSLSHSLAAALADPEPIVRASVDGRVEAGTFEGLVQRLFTDTGQTSEDVAYRFIFLACYRIFTSSSHLFQRLRAYYEDVDDGNHEDCGEDCRLRRYSILLLIQTWLQLDYEDLDETVLMTILVFARSIQGSQTFLAISREIVSLVEHKIAYIEPDPSPGLSVHTNPRVAIPRASDILPLELAVALTVLEGTLFSQITHFDCLAQLQRLAGARRVERAVGASNRIMNWVKKSILRSDSPDIRADVYKFFINVAEECAKLANFASMAAIVNALQSSTIRRLVLTRELSNLRKHEKGMLNRMVELLDPGRNHRAYRAAIRDHKNATVPWLAVHLHDLHAVLVSHPAAVDADTRPLINFSRFSALTAAIRDVLQFKVPDLRQQKSPGVLAYLEAQLRATPPDANLEAFEARSKQLAESEETLRAQRLPELRALGFATPETSARAHNVPLTRSSTVASKRDPGLAGFS